MIDPNDPGIVRGLGRPIGPGEILERDKKRRAR